MTIKTENEFFAILKEKNILTDAMFSHMLSAQKKTGESLFAALCSMPGVQEDAMLQLASEVLGIPYVRFIRDVVIEDRAVKHVPAKIAYRYAVLPVSYRDNQLVLCTANPFDMHAHDDLRILLNCVIFFNLAPREEIRQALNKSYGVGANAVERLSQQETLEAMAHRPVVETIDTEGEDASIITFVNQILLDAKRARATDIHIEPFEHDVKIRYRVDGVLYDIKVPPDIKRIQSHFITRIKIISGLDISEHRLPQDGRIKMRTTEGELDLRVSILPTPYGESISIRILSATQLLELEQLGFSGDHLKVLEKIISQPHGIILLTGPTGSGKTTTLYACLNRINTRDRKIITIEDPIEYQLEGITQIQVHPKIGLTFSQGLRSMLRHDPDVMMVGEVRDIETAEITIRVSLTGHLVFSTLHTNDAPGAVSRLSDMGIESYLISSSVSCVIAQRLIRVLCEHCKKEYRASASELNKMGFPAEGDMTLYHAAGCVSCGHTGYKGRSAIVEMMIVNDELRKMIMKQASSSELMMAARRNGMTSLRDDGWHKIRQGMTSVDEVMRVTLDQGM